MSLPYGYYKITVAFYDYLLDERKQQQQASYMMRFYDWVSRIYHRNELSQFQQKPDTVPSIYIHCAIILNHDDDEYCYDYIVSGARCSIRTFNKKETPAWNAFRNIIVDRTHYQQCKSFLDAEVEFGGNNKYDQIVMRPFAWLSRFVTLEQEIIHYKFPIVLAPFRFLPLVGDCIPGANEWYTCSSFVCRTLQIAGVEEMRHFSPCKTTSHTIWLALQKYPCGGPNNNY